MFVYVYYTFVNGRVARKYGFVWFSGNVLVIDNQGGKGVDRNGIVYVCLKEVGQEASKRNLKWLR